MVTTTTTRRRTLSVPWAVGFAAAKKKKRFVCVFFALIELSISVWVLGYTERDKISCNWIFVPRFLIFACKASIASSEEKKQKKRSGSEEGKRWSVAWIIIAEISVSRSSSFHFPFLKSGATIQKQDNGAERLNANKRKQKHPFSHSKTLSFRVGNNEASLKTLEFF